MPIVARSLRRSAISGERAALHLPVGNLVNRLLGCALVLPFLPEISAHLARIEPDPGRLAAGFHLTLNAALAALFLLPLPLLARALKRVLPDRPKHGNPAAPRYLDPGLPRHARSGACERRA